MAVAAVDVPHHRADTARDLTSTDLHLDRHLGLRKAHHPRVVVVAADTAVGLVAPPRPVRGLRQGDVAVEALAMRWIVDVGAEAPATIVMLIGVDPLAAVVAMGTDEIFR